MGLGSSVIVIDTPVLSSERALHINIFATDSNKNIVLDPRRGLEDRLAD
jgi:hypothetical protein